MTYIKAWFYIAACAGAAVGVIVTFVIWLL